MEALEKVIGFFENFDIDNIWMLLVISIVLLSVISSYIQLFHASQIEAVFMSKTDEYKRYSFLYVIFFVVFGVANYLFVIDSSVVVANSLVLMLTILISKVLHILKDRGKAEKIYWWFKDKENLFVIFTFMPILIFVVSTAFNINLVSCIIVGAFAEVVVAAMAFFNVSNKRSFTVLNIDNEKWYVFKRVDENYLLCGNKCNINDSTRTKLLAIDYIVEQKLSFEKDMVEKK